jgi:predicted DNA-binding transcriptional regulator YafY
MNRIDRLLGYLIMLQSRALVRAQDLAAQFAVSERTVYRDMDALAEIGVPIVGIAGEGYRLMEGYSLPPVMFSEPEARALYLAIAMLTSFTGDGPTKTAATTALAKVRAVLPVALRSQVETLQTVLGFYTVGRPPLNLDEPLFLDLQRAINERRVVYLHYHALRSNRITAREVEPLRLAFVDNAWMLHSYCRLRQDYRNFRLDRIDRLNVKAESFEPRPVHLPKPSPGDRRVRVRFSPDVVRWVREAQHFTFREEETAEDDESGVVMIYQVDELPQITYWLLRWGDDMEVLEPAELRTALQAIGKRLAQRHHQEIHEIIEK